MKFLIFEIPLSHGLAIFVPKFAIVIDLERSAFLHESLHSNFPILYFNNRNITIYLNHLNLIIYYNIFFNFSIFISVCSFFYIFAFHQHTLNIRTIETPIFALGEKFSHCMRFFMAFNYWHHI